MRILRCIPFLSAVLGLAQAIPAWAQTAVPDAGALRQQIEQQREMPLPPAARPAPAAPAAEAKSPQGATVKVRAFRFVGHNLISVERLQAAVSPFLGQSLDFEGLQRTTDAVAAAYRKAGWLARVFLPEQDISEGTITLQVVEARFAGVRLEGKPPTHVRPAELEALLKGRQQAGQPLKVEEVDRALLLAEDLPGVRVAGTLSPGEADGETVLIVQASDEPRINGDLTLDNTGSRSTGTRRQMLNVNFNSIGGRGELATLTVLHTAGSDYARLALTVPDGYNGLRLTASGSTMSYRVLNNPAQLEGRSTSAGLDFNYPLVRTRLKNLYVLGGLENKRFFNRNITQVASAYETNTTRLGLSANGFDDWRGGGANTALLQLHWGQLDSMVAHTQKDVLRPRYHKISYALSRQQTLAADHSLMLNLSGQHAVQNLDSSERFYLGGASSVRAYPSSEIGGERGQLASVEWRWRVRPTLQLAAFADAGRVAALPATASDTKAHLNLRGAGVNLAWQGPKGVSAKVTWSRRYGTNPKPTPQGTDSDGTLRLNRLWLALSIAF